ncbi:MAG: flagellar motor switch protein FliN [Thermotogae bacterium]|nr:flagellar motor switch protein FliN [Thermotogota bacterium]
MSDEFLSQEELDALLKGLVSDSDDLPPEIEEYLKYIADGFNNALSAITGKVVKIGSTKVEKVTVSALKDKIPEKFVVSSVNFTGGLKGVNIVLVNEEDASRVSDMMMGGSGEASEMDDLKLSAFVEVLSQMMGSAATSLAEYVGGSVTFAPPESKIAQRSMEQIPYINELKGDIFLGSFSLEYEKNAALTFNFLIPKDFVEQLPKEEKEKEVAQSAPMEAVQTAPSEPQHVEKTQVKVKPVEFEEFGTPSISREEMQKLELLLDVPLSVSVELGRTKMTLKQILELNEGSIVELDKLTGEPVDMLVNGKIVARGEVVIVDENFAIRITEIVSPRERLLSLR